MTRKQLEKMIAVAESVLAEFKPMFDEHGGGAELVAIEKDEITLRLLGNCAGCSMADVHFGIDLEEKLRKKLPSVKRITYSY